MPFQGQERLSARSYCEITETVRGDAALLLHTEAAGITAPDSPVVKPKCNELTNICRVGVRRMGPSSFQWCPATGQGAMGTN